MEGLEGGRDTASFLASGADKCVAEKGREEKDEEAEVGCACCLTRGLLPQLELPLLLLLLLLLPVREG